MSGSFILVTNRTQSWTGLAQNITSKVKLHTTYQLSAWVRIRSVESATHNINIAFIVDSRHWMIRGQIEVGDYTWHEIWGSFRIEKQASEITVNVHGPSSDVELMVAGLQMFPVDRKARFSYLKKQTNKVSLFFLIDRTDRLSLFARENDAKPKDVKRSPFMLYLTGAKEGYCTKIFKF